MASEPLPPNYQRARELLLERGELAPGDLAAALAEEGRRIDPARLAALPDRFPGQFEGLPDGTIAAVTTGAGNDDPTLDLLDDGSVGEAAWRVAPAPERLTFDRVVVLDIETTGLDMTVDEVWELAAVNLGTGDSLHLRLPVAPELEPKLPAVEAAAELVALDEALRGFDAFFDGMEAVAGQNVAGFDLPFLAAQAARAGIAWNPPALVIDLLDLSVLVDPTLSDRRLGDLCAALGIALDDAHRAVADATATGAAIRALLERIDPADPSWQLAGACLAAGRHPLSRVLPPMPRPSTARDGLVPAVDPLCEPQGDIEPTTAVESVFFGLRALEGNGFRERRGQSDMARAVADTVDGGGRLAVEAPTGTGKSFAYLLPAAGRASRRHTPVVVATATKVLQTQLRRDALTLRTMGMFKVPFRQVQGVANYICAREVADAVETTEPGSPDWFPLAVAVRALATSETGVWDEITEGPALLRNAGYRLVRDSLRTDSQGCERQHCDQAAVCPLMRRLDGLDRIPGVLAVNHALVAAWVNAERAGGRAPGDVLHEADLIFDEGHNLEDTLTGAWTDTLTEFHLRGLLLTLEGRRGPLRLARRAARVAGAELGSLARLGVVRRRFVAAVGALGEAVATYIHEYGGSQRTCVLAAGLIRGREEYRSLRAATFEVLMAARALSEVVDGLREDLSLIAGEPDREDHPAASGRPGRTAGARWAAIARWRLRSFQALVAQHIDLLNSLRDLPDEHRLVHLLSQEAPDRTRPADPGPWSYQRVPIHIGERFASDVCGPAHSVTLTSATLAVGGTFDFLGRRLGITVTPGGGGGPGSFTGLRLDSPFDYSHQSAVVLTNHLPIPLPSSEREFVEEMAADQIGFLSLAGGKALVLFAARSRMEAVAKLVDTRAADLGERGVRLLVQGREARTEIAERFRKDFGAVAYGLRSYWEGFDAPGETLTYLVIEKPPYPHPDDPIIAARQRAIADRGGDPFTEYIIPKTAILLAQGFGRLIRSEDDRGVALVCDRRLQSPSLANRILLETLPGPTIHYADDRADAWSYAIEFATGTAPDLSLALTPAVDDVTQRLEDLRLLPGEDPEEKLRLGARLLFGIEDLRPQQLSLMRALLEGRDALGVLPTGFGKSLCFQLPALLGAGPGATVVVSPLVALIKDQVDALRGRRGLRPVQGITSRTSGTARTELLRDLADGRIRLLYVSPERLVRDPVLHRALARQQLAALVVDEAHCVSVWGHDFRPEFRQIAPAVKDFVRSPRLGLTATATPEVERDVKTQLALQDPFVVRESADRPNLRFRVQKCADERARAREMLRIVTHFGRQPGIIYAGRKATTEEVASLLRRAHVSARHYHAGMVPEQREAVQEDFFAGSTQVIVATKAFGMGIDKPDIGWVLHYDLPESLDGYAQEAGRAARDTNLVGDCVLLYTERDVMRRKGQVSCRSTSADVQIARRALAALTTARRRGDSVVFDPETFADDLGIEEDELNVVLAWLERVGSVERIQDCSARGTVVCGHRQPSDREERLKFERFFTVGVRAQPDVRKIIDFDTLEDERGYDPDELERELVGWSLDRLVTFTSSARYWRVRLLDASFDEARYRIAVDEWRVWQSRRLEALIAFVRGTGCRRKTIAAHFGDVADDCHDRAVLCDQCDPSPPPWSFLDDTRVPDPETLVNVDLAVLQAVAWASSFAGGRYGEASLSLAVQGRDTWGNGQPLGAGVLNCPQFGALRHVKGAEGRWKASVAKLVGEGLIRRDDVPRQSGGVYQSLAVTEAGVRALGGTIG
jgi:ATP-dependent DNA helicase RecQ